MTKKFAVGQRVKIKANKVAIIANQMAENMDHLRAVIGWLEPNTDSQGNLTQWDWVFVTEQFEGISVCEDELEAVQP